MKNRENYFRNRSSWCLKGGPLIVMDDPTEDHVKALLAHWLSPRKLLGEIEQQVRLTKRTTDILEALQETVPGHSDMLWRRLAQIATMAVPVEPLPTMPKIQNV